MAAMYYSGSGSSIQLGKETTYGTKPIMTEMLAFLSESIKLAIERKTEETLLSSKTSREMDVMGSKVSGDISVILKPENLKEILYLTLGNEEAPTLKATTTGVYEHEFTPIDSLTPLPSFTATIDRHASIPAYTGLKVDSLKMDFAAGDYAKATMTIKGKGEEVVGTLAGLTAPAHKAYRFVNGSMTIDGSTFGDVSSVNLTYSNGMDDGALTLGSGIYSTEAHHGQRDIKIDFETFYTDTVESIRTNKYKLDGAYANIVLNFQTPEEIETGHKYSMKIELPKVVINECSPNIGGADKINLTISGQALEGASEAIIITVRDDENEKAFN